jgi:hypothetical protein
VQSVVKQNRLSTLQELKLAFLPGKSLMLYESLENANKFLQRTQQSWAAEEKRYVAYTLLDTGPSHIGLVCG